MQDDQPPPTAPSSVTRESQSIDVPDHPSPMARGPTTSSSRRHELLISALKRLGTTSPQAKARSRQGIEMYREALRAYHRLDTVESLHVAAYELREFMNHLPRIVDVPRVSHVDIRTKARTLLEKWNNRNRSVCNDNDRWVGYIDGPLRKLLDQLKHFCEWFDQYVPTRRQEAAETIRRLYPSPQPLPLVIMAERTKTWSDLLGYFNRIAHHNLKTDPVAFAQKLADLEIFLLDQIQPRTSDTFDAIDQMIEEAEGHSI